jgi:hypothetical protein
MESLGLNTAFLLVQLIYCVIPLAWLVLSIAALLNLKKKNINLTAQAIWALTICIVPVIGAVAFWIIDPQEKASLD